MIEMLNTISQTYGIQHHDHQIHHEHHTTNKPYNNNNNNNNKKQNEHNKIKFYQTLTSYPKTTAATNPTKTNATESRGGEVGGGGSGSGVLSDFFASLSSIQSIKSPTHYIEKFINFDLLNNYETLRLSNKYFPHNSASAKTTTDNKKTQSQQSFQQHQQQQRRQENKSSVTLNVSEGIWNEFNCLQGKYRNKCDTDIVTKKHPDADANADADADIYEAVRFNVNVNNLKNSSAKVTTAATTVTNMINKCSHNFLAETVNIPAAATLQNFQKLPECDQDAPKDTISSGPSSSSSDINSDNAIFKQSQLPTSLGKRFPIEKISKNGSVRIYVDACPTYSRTPLHANESASENSSSSIAATTTTTYSSSTVQRTSSASSSGEYHAKNNGGGGGSSSSQVNFYLGETVGSNTQNERLQRRKLMQMIASLDQQNKVLQRELARERRRRNEELARVVKSLLCFESKLKSDMKSVNQRMEEKDIEICRLTRQNRALKKAYVKVQKSRQTQDEGVITDDVTQSELAQKLGLSDKWQADELEDNLLEDCLVLEALQCINCRKQFYDIGIKEGWTQSNNILDGSRNNDDHTTEHGSSSDDTVSSSFYGARRSVRYTSKRTAGTFRDYMRSRSMHVDDNMLADCVNWENTSTLSRDSHSSTSNEKLNYLTQNETNQIKMNCEQNDSNNSSKISAIDATEEDDGIFSPTQDDDFEEYMETTTTIAIANKNITIAAVNNCMKTTITPEFSEASPKQIYETSADDWYASASDQEDISDGRNTKCYTLAAVNPVLECVNQILLQQTMEEPLAETIVETKEISTTSACVPLTNLPRRSSLSGRRQGRTNSQGSDAAQTTTARNKNLTRKRVHFSTKNSMVHLPRQESDNEQEEKQNNLQPTIMPINIQQTCYPTRYFATISTPSPTTMIRIPATPPTSMPLVMQDATERLDTLNYESIYSNEYEPIGSERNSSNLYVEMETERNKTSEKNRRSLQIETTSKVCKTPPALPPKPANLMKFKKSLLNLTEVKGDNTSTISEPDYCSISEVNVGMTSVQIVADVHKAPESVLSGNDLEANTNFSELNYAGEEVATVNSDETCAASQKTEEIEEIFADIPKLPNVAAIIAPRNQTKYQQKQQPQKLILHQSSTTKSMLSDYLSMSPKTPKFQTVQKLLINTTESADKLHFGSSSGSGTHKLVITNGNNTPNANNNNNNNNNNKRLNSNKNHSNNTITKINSATTLLQDLEAVGVTGTLPLQEEFDWYNLDAEYGKAKVTVNEHKVQNGCLAEINEDHENERELVTSAADEYNLDEEFCLSAETLDSNNDNIITDNNNDDNMQNELNTVIRENMASRNNTTKKMHKNLDTFEKFIEGSGLSTKPLPHKRKIYFAGPFV